MSGFMFIFVYCFVYCGSISIAIEYYSKEDVMEKARHGRVHIIELYDIKLYY